MGDTKISLDSVYNYLASEMFPSLEIRTYEVDPAKEDVYIQKMEEIFKEHDDYMDNMQSVNVFNKKLSWNIQRNMVTILLKRQETIQYALSSIFILLSSKNSKYSIFFYIKIMTTYSDNFTSSYMDDHGIVSRLILSQKIKNYGFVPSSKNVIFFYSFHKKPYASNPNLQFLFPTKFSFGKTTRTPVMKTIPIKKSDDDIMDVQKFYQYVISKMKQKEKEILEGSLSSFYFDTIKNICKEGDMRRITNLKTKEDIIEKIKIMMDGNVVIYLTGYEKRAILGEDDIWVDEEFASSSFCIVVCSRGSDTPIIFIKSRDSEYVKTATGMFSKEKILDLIGDMAIMEKPEKVSFIYFYKKRFADCPELKSEVLPLKTEKPSFRVKKKEEPLLFNPEYDCMQRASYGRRNVYSKEDLVKIAMTLKLFKTKSEASKMTKPELCKYIKARLSK